MARSWNKEICAGTHAGQRLYGNGSSSGKIYSPFLPPQPPPSFSRSESQPSSIILMKLAWRARSTYPVLTRKLTTVSRAIASFAPQLLSSLSLSNEFQPSLLYVLVTFIYFLKLLFMPEYYVSLDILIIIYK